MIGAQYLDSFFGIFKKLSSFIIPDSLRSDVVQASYANIIVGIGFISNIIILVSFVINIYFNELTAISILLALVFGINLSLILLAKTKEILYSREVLSATFFTIAAFSTIYRGSIFIPSVYWLVVPPIISVMCGGFRSSIIWFFLSCIIVFFLSKHISLEQSAIKAIKIDIPIYISIIFLFIFIYFSFYLSELGKIRGLKLRYRAYHDPLTGALNRFTLEDKLKTEINSNNTFYLIKVDINNFHHLNDTLGLNVCDNILIQVFSRLKNIFPKDTLISRFSNDDFYIVYNINHPGIDNKSILNNILSALNKPYSRKNAEDLIITCSVGISSFPEDSKDVSDLIRYTELAYEKAYESGGHSIKYFDASLAKDDKYNLLIKHHIQYALKNNEFVLNFQPKISTKKPHKIVGMEVLLRWENETLGKVPPGKFIPIAEQMGLITDIGGWVFIESLRQFKEWEKQNIINEKMGISISINFVVPQIQKLGALAVIKNTLLDFNLDPKYLEIEITESDFITDKNSIIDLLTNLQSLGISIAIDDFGTGYSSFGYLKDLPVNILKIDKVFIDDIVEDDRIVKSIIILAHQLNLKVVAEGVETKEQLDVLAACDCDVIQGYFFSRPVPASEMEDLILEYSS
ncbi:bifunctional diguanylate cyclase/phosphodiesterase [Gammaproteobacteria bacterium]|nr:bifunctional diguanylate cyclase/phosphodiesterase [Gammaproteobacteria bacterium]